MTEPQDSGIPWICSWNFAQVDAKLTSKDGNKPSQALGLPSRPTLRHLSSPEHQNCSGPLPKELLSQEAVVDELTAFAKLKNN